MTQEEEFKNLAEEAFEGKLKITPTMKEVAESLLDENFFMHASTVKVKLSKLIKEGKLSGSESVRVIEYIKWKRTHI